MLSDNDKDLFKACFSVDKIYPNESAGVAAFNRYLQAQHFADAVSAFTLAPPAIASMHALPSFLMQVNLIEQFSKKLTQLFEENRRFVYAIEPSASAWLTITNESDAAQTEISKTLKVLCAKNTSERSIFRDAARLQDLIKLWVAFDTSAVSLCNTAQQFLTNVGFGEDLKRQLLAGQVIVLDDLSDDRMLGSCFSFPRNGIRMKDSAPKFLMLRSKFIALASGRRS